MAGMACKSFRRFDVVVRRGMLTNAFGPLVEWLGGRRVLIVATPTVSRLYGARLRDAMADAGIDATMEVLPLGERHKTLNTVKQLCDIAQGQGLGRRDVFAAFGGGVCCDVVSVAASLYRRGVPYITLPTTLIGQVDAGVGIKGAVNAGGRKNVLGCYWPPEAVFVDPSLLESLPVRHLRSGAAELVKIALIADPDLFQQLYEHGASLLDSGFAAPRVAGDAIIERAIELILRELEPNCFEDHSYERSLDLGHTFSPKLEEASHYAILHGEAVAIDIALTCRIGVRMGWLSPADARQVIGLFVRLGLPCDDRRLDVDLAIEAIAAAAAHRDGALNLPIPTGIGRIRYLRDAAELQIGELAALLPPGPRRYAKADQKTTAASQDHDVGCGAGNAARQVDIANGRPSDAQPIISPPRNPSALPIGLES
jgi:2-epi-5-epi-valiolone synthase